MVGYPFVQILKFLQKRIEVIATQYLITIIWVLTSMPYSHIHELLLIMMLTVVYKPSEKVYVIQLIIFKILFI